MDLNLFKDRDELKKFLENLGTEYRYGCYSEKNPTACHLLGDYFYSIDKDIEKAYGTYRKNCDENKHGLSCDAFGRLAYKGVPPNGSDCKLALEYFVKGCDLNDPRSCYHGGQMYGVKDPTVNKLIPPDVDKALKMLEKSCDSKKEPESCFLIHSMFINGTQGLEKDMKKAAVYAEKACDQNHFAGCRNLARMYRLGDGVEQNNEKSKMLYGRSQEILDGKRETIKAKTPDRPDL